MNYLVESKEAVSKVLDSEVALIENQAQSLCKIFKFSD